MAKTQTRFVCQSCGHESPKWLGRCPDCGAWTSLVEEQVAQASADSSILFAPSSAPLPLTEIKAAGAPRSSSGISEFDRVLGGGLVAGSLVLIGGDPGIGKSTMLIQVASHLSQSSGPVLYVSGEESAEQIKLRTNRIGIASKQLYVASETNIQAIERFVADSRPSYLVVDSIQSVFDPELTSAPGTVSQVRWCTTKIARIAKTMGIGVFIVGHVTKDGSLAGPRVLEHMVDTVLYFEGDRHHAYRVVRAVKNRFGSTDELGVFEMREDGLAEVTNPSEALLSERPKHGTGSVVAAVMEGSRPLLVEIQALVSPSHFTSPRRLCTGLDYNKLTMILAVLEKRVGLSLASKDVYVNVAGGIKIMEPAVDMSVALAVASSLLELQVDSRVVAIGEIGLAGEIRTVSHTERRIKEAIRLGFDRAVVAKLSADRLPSGLGIHLEGVASLRCALDAAFIRSQDIAKG